MKDTHGFTLIELLGAVVILGLLGTIAITGTASYLHKSRLKSYTIMSQSVYEATEHCIMDNKCKLVGRNDGRYNFKISDLQEWGYLQELKNPIEKKENCSGKVIVNRNSYDEFYKNISYDVELNCPGLKVNKNVIRWPDDKDKNVY